MILEFLASPQFMVLGIVLGILLSGIAFYLSYYNKLKEDKRIVENWHKESQEGTKDE